MTPQSGFVPTDGLKVSGEIGWHAHGSGDLKDTDIDLAIIIESTAAIDPSYTTMVLWGISMGNEGVASTGIEYEVGYFGYERGTLTDVKAWDL